MTAMSMRISLGRWKVPIGVSLLHVVSSACRPIPMTVLRIIGQ